MDPTISPQGNHHGAVHLHRSGRDGLGALADPPTEAQRARRRRLSRAQLTSRRLLRPHGMAGALPRLGDRPWSTGAGRSGTRGGSTWPSGRRGSRPPPPARHRTRAGRAGGWRRWRASSGPAARPGRPRCPRGRPCSRRARGARMPYPPSVPCTYLLLDRYAGPPRRWRDSSTAGQRPDLRGCSSGGRAAALQAAGPGFESPQLHNQHERPAQQGSRNPLTRLTGARCH
jgi:hypothetical protein